MYIENQDVNTLGIRGINARGDGTSGLWRLCRQRLSSIGEAGKFLGFTPRIPAVFSRWVVQLTDYEEAITWFRKYNPDMTDEQAERLLEDKE